MFFKVIVFIKNISKIICYICIKVDIYFVKYVNYIIGYIFIVVVINIFYNCLYVRVMNCKMFISIICCK